MKKSIVLLISLFFVVFFTTDVFAGEKKPRTITRVATGESVYMPSRGESSSYALVNAVNDDEKNIYGQITDTTKIYVNGKRIKKEQLSHLNQKVITVAATGNRTNKVGYPEYIFKKLVITYFKPNQFAKR